MWQINLTIDQVKEEWEYGMCDIKLGMLKAYDMVEWIFLKNMLNRRGFASVWIKMIMSYLSSINYQVRFNRAGT